MDDEEWLKVAMEDDSVVVNLLLRLSQPLPPSPMPDSFPSSLHLDWTVRQPRSKPIPRQSEPKVKTEPARASPTTPLSWSGATSASGGVPYGFEESSRSAKSPGGPRSKIEVKNAVTMTTKKSRRKKTLPELKEEESLLLKERNHLKNILTSLRLTVEKERARNKILKKMKIDLKTKTVCNSTPIISAKVCCKNLDVLHSDLSRSKSQEVGAFGNAIILPDLNLPLDENSGPDTFYGVR